MQKASHPHLKLESTTALKKGVGSFEELGVIMEGSVTKPSPQLEPKAPCPQPSTKYTASARNQQGVCPQPCSLLSLRLLCFCPLQGRPSPSLEPRSCRSPLE